MKSVIALKLSLPRPSLRPHLEPSIRDQPRLHMLPRTATFAAGRGAQKTVKSMSKVFKRSKSTVAMSSQADALLAIAAEVALPHATPVDAVSESAPAEAVNDEPASIVLEKTSSSQSASAPVCRCSSCSSVSPPRTSTIPFPSKPSRGETSGQSTAKQLTAKRPILRRLPVMSFSALGLKHTIQRELSSATHISSLTSSASFVTARTSVSRSSSENSMQDNTEDEAENLRDAAKFPSNITDLSALMQTHLTFTPSGSRQSEAFWRFPPVSSTILVLKSPAAPPSSPVPHAALVQEYMFLRTGPRAMKPQAAPGVSPFLGSMTAKSV